MSKSFSRTYPVDTKGAPFGDLTRSQLGGLTTRLRADAKKEGLTLGDTEVVSRAGTIGGVFDVTVRAVVSPTEKTEAQKVVEPAELNVPADTTDAD